MGWLIAFLAVYAMAMTALAVREYTRAEGALDREDLYHDLWEDSGEIIANVRDERRDEARQYMERVKEYENRISELIRQNQNLAERVASLRLSSPEVDGGDDFHVEESPEKEPWSAELQQLYAGIESTEAQQEMESFVEQRRARGMQDEQILRELEDHWGIA